jgi:CheY-like chemotaxis protein
MAAIRVLHVEDEPDLREIVEIALGHPDFVTRSCGSGQEAIAIALDWLPDIILLDVMMPEMDGPATLERLRGNAQTAKTPVVFMTAHAQNREVQHLRLLGVAGVIQKLFDVMALAASVRGYVQPGLSAQAPVPHDKPAMMLLSE